MARVKDPNWTRKPGPAGGTCGAKHTHISGHVIVHCGHPTALWPYYIVTPKNETILAPNGRGFKFLTDAKTEVEHRTNPAATRSNT